MNTTAAGNRPFDDRALDFKGAAQFLQEVGFGNVSDTTVWRMADQKTLPFFKGPKNRRVIMESALRSWLLKRQADAQRAVEDAGKRRPTSRGGRK